MRQKRIKSVMRLPFHSFILCNTSCERRKKKKRKKGQPSSAIWIASDSTVCLGYGGYGKHLLEAPCPCLMVCGDAANLCEDLSFSSCSWPGRTRAPMGADSRWRGHLPEHSGQHLAHSGGLTASAEQALACLGWEI